MTDSSMTQWVEQLPTTRSVLAVCAHPDDESFGLGAALATFDESGTSTSVLCFTHGEASTLGADTPELGRVRAGELAAAADELGVAEVELLHYRDGQLSDEPLAELNTRIHRAVQRAGADLLLVFDEGGITGHADHCRASEAAVAVARELGLPVLAWTLPERVADALNLQFGAGFVGRSDTELDYVVQVDRTRQRRAIDQHVSQAVDNPVLGRRLALQGDEEAFRWLLAPK
jgi:LmbE family N-acetylglucosaminyl deacetylase